MAGSRSKPGAAERMVDVAVRRIAAEGMTVSLDTIRMEAVIAEAGVSRATAYRRWPTREEFLADVLVATVRRTSLVPETESELADLVELVAAHTDRLLDEQGRRDLVVESLRRSVDGDVRRILASPAERTYLSLAASYPSLPAGRVRDAVGAALRETEAAFVERRAHIYANLAELIGYRLAPPLTGEEGFRTFSAATGLTMTGIIVRAIPDAAWLDARERLVLHGASEPADWSEPERILVGQFLAHLEPDPTITWDEATLRTFLARFERQVGELMGLPSRPAVPPAQRP